VKGVCHECAGLPGLNTFIDDLLNSGNAPVHGSRFRSESSFNAMMQEKKAKKITGSLPGSRDRQIGGNSPVDDRGCPGKTRPVPEVKHMG
jgi:hypothetical protein